MAAVLGPYPFFEIFDDDGNKVPGAQLYWTLSGTSTPAVVWHDSAMSAAWTDPVVCDAAARALVYFDPAVGNLKLRIADALGVFFGLTIDPYTATAGAAGPGGVGAELFSFGSNSSAVITATAYASGATFDLLQPGTGVWLVDPATLTGTYRLEVTGVMTAAGTLSVSLMNLDGGAPDTPLATATLTSLTGAVSQSGPITFPPGGVALHFGLKTLVSASDGYLIGARIVRTA